MSAAVVRARGGGKLVKGLGIQARDLESVRHIPPGRTRSSRAVPLNLKDKSDGGRTMEAGEKGLRE